MDFFDPCGWMFCLSSAAKGSSVTNGLTIPHLSDMIKNIRSATYVSLFKEKNIMPRKFMFTREEILAAALDLAREQGIAAVTARRLGEKLGSSSKPVFSLFENMEDVLSAVMEAADGLYQNYLKEDMARGKYPPYKASGMAYIRFAKEEKELFKLLFMRDRSQESIEEKGENKPLIELVQQDLGISEEDARLFHLEMWIYVHGMATMLATSYLELDEGLISRVLTDGYEGMKVRYIGGGSI